MDINYLALLACGVVAMIVGFVWYGPLFGKRWMEVIGATELDEMKRKEMQKKAGPLYLVQFLLVLLQVFILGNLITWSGGNGMIVATFMWLGFVVPTLAGSSMWNNDSSKIKWARFLIQAGYYLVLFIIFGYILGTWR